LDATVDADRNGTGWHSKGKKKMGEHIAAALAPATVDLCGTGPCETTS
jgi:hypothetical protein